MAGALGVDAVEVDVRVTADLVPVLIHDPWYQPSEGAPVAVHARTFEELCALPRRDNGLPLATFEAALEALPAGLTMAIDIKESRAAEPVLEVLERFRDRPVMLWGRSLSVLRRCTVAQPDVERALLRDTRQPASMPRYLDDAARCGAQAISPRWELVTPELVAEAHGRGLEVYSMVDRAGSPASKVAMGLDGVVTDWPEEARSAVG